MSVKVLTRTMFIVWVIAVTILSVIPHPNNEGMLSVRLTPTGMVKHFIANFIGALLCYYAYERDGILFILTSGFLIFLYSAVLEIIQVYLPYRTFNVDDIAANGSGILLFVLIWGIYWMVSSRFFTKRRRSFPDA